MNQVSLEPEKYTPEVVSDADKEVSVTCSGCNEEIPITLMRRNLYVCPKCGHFMGNQPYDILAQGKACPYCRAQFKAK